MNVHVTLMITTALVLAACTAPYTPTVGSNEADTRIGSTRERQPLRIGVSGPVGADLEPAMQKAGDFRVHLITNHNVTIAYYYVVRGSHDALKIFGDLMIPSDAMTVSLAGKTYNVTSPPGRYSPGDIIRTDGPSKPIDGGATAVFDAHEVVESRLRERLAKLSDPAMICLDIEGELMDQLFDSNNPRHDYATAQFVRAARIAREMHPDALVGFYALPQRQYWKLITGDKENSIAKWRKQTFETLAPIWREVNCVMPSIYDFYHNQDQNSAGSDATYVQKNVRLALEVAARYDNIHGGVWPWVWGDFHDSNKKWGGKLIPFPEFASHLKQAASAEYESSRIAGFCWWHTARSKVQRGGNPPHGVKKSLAKPYLDWLEAQQWNRLSEVCGRSLRVNVPPDPRAAK